MKRTLTAAAAGLAILAGGVVAASPAAASNNVQVSVNTIMSWTLDKPPVPQYKTWVGDDGDTNDTQDCGEYDGDEICFFTVPSAGLFSSAYALYTQEPFYVISSNGYRYKVSGFSAQITNPPVGDMTFGSMPHQESNTIPITTRWWGDWGDYGLEIWADAHLSNQIAAWEDNQARDASGSPVTDAAKALVEEVKKEQGDISARSFRSTIGDNTYRVMAKHHTRLEKLATKVHNRGGALTVHAYGSDKGLALTRARAVRAHLEEHLAKRGYVGPSPVHVLYVGDPGDKNGIHANVHWHKDGAPMSPIPGLDIVPVPIGAGASDS